MIRILQLYGANKNGFFGFCCRQMMELLRGMLRGITELVVNFNKEFFAIFLFVYKLFEAVVSDYQSS